MHRDWSGDDHWYAQVANIVRATRESGADNIYGYEIWNEPQGTYAGSNPLSFNDFWAQTYAELRSSLIPMPDHYAFDRTPVRLSPIMLGPPPRPDCSQLRGRDRRDCEHRN